MLKYEQIATILRRQIEDGTFPADTQLPTTEQLCAAHGVSKITIKKAMDELVRLGLVARRRGAGTFVKNSESPAMPFDWQHETKIVGTTARYAEQGKKLESRLLDFSVAQPPEHVRAKLGLGEDEFAYHVTRTRFIDGEPLNVEYAYFPLSRVSGLTPEIANGSIYRYLIQELGLKISSSHATMRAVLPTGDEAAWLGIPAATPLFEIEQVVFLNTGRAFEYSITRNTERVEPQRTVRLYD